MGKINLLLCGIHYPYTMMSWFWRALDRRSDLEIRTLGAFTGDWIPWAGGIRIPMRYVRNINYPLSGDALHPSWALAKGMMGDWQPDIVLTVDAGWHFSDKPQVPIVAHVATDPHSINYDFQRKISDFFFNMQVPYWQQGDYFLPYAYDPTMNYHEEVPKEYDCCLLGLHYEHRNALVARLRGRGLNVYYDLGPIYDEYRLLNNKAKVVLSWSSLKDTPLRIWEAMGMQLPLVANRTPDIMGFFKDGEDFLGFDSVEEAENKVMMFLQDEELRNRVAFHGHQTVLPHTWDARIEYLLKICGVV